MLEKSVEQYLRRQVVARGGLCVKMDTEKGIPDRLVLTADGRHCFVELKQPTGRLSPIQIEYHKRLRQRKHKVFVLWDYNDVDKFLADYLDRGKDYDAQER